MCHPTLYWKYDCLVSSITIHQWVQAVDIPLLHKLMRKSKEVHKVLEKGDEGEKEGCSKKLKI